MEESSYKHNYEYLSFEEAKAIVNGTFVQGTTNIGGELATKADIDYLLERAGKKLTSIVPVTDTSNEFICFFECVDNRVDPTGVHVTNIIIQVGQNQKIQYELTPSNATVDTCTYEVTSGSEYVHITDGVVYADAVGQAVCKITINGNVESTFQIEVINGNVERHYGDVFIIQTCVGGSTVFVDLHSPEYCFNPSSWSPQYNNYMVYPHTYIKGIDTGVFYSKPQMLIDIDQIRKTYQQIKNKPSLIKGKTIEQACQIHGGHYAYVYLYSNNYVIGGIGSVNAVKCRWYKKSSGASISFDGSMRSSILKGFTNTSDFKNINYLTYGCVFGNAINRVIPVSDYDHISSETKSVDYFLRCGTLFSFIMIDLDSNNETPISDIVSFNDGYFEKGYNIDSAEIQNTSKELLVDITQNSLSTDGDNIELNITINKINNSTDITFLRSIMVATCYNNNDNDLADTFYSTDNNGAFFYNDGGIKLPYTTQINIPKKDFSKIGLYMCAIDTESGTLYKTSTPIKEIVL